MEIRNESLKIRKVKITDIKLFSKNYSNVSTRHFGNDVYVNHSNYTDEHERIYYEEDNGAVGIIETINQQTLFKNGGECLLASIENKYLGYKNKNQQIEYSPLLKKEKSNIGFRLKILNLFLFIVTSIPLLSVFIYYPMIKESKNVYYRPIMFKYNFLEENLFLIGFALNIIFNIGFISGIAENSDFIGFSSLIGLILSSALIFSKYYLISKDFENKKETLKNNITKKIEEIERSN